MIVTSDVYVTDILYLLQYIQHKSAKLSPIHQYRTHYCTLGGLMGRYCGTTLPPDLTSSDSTVCSCCGGDTL